MLSSNKDKNITVIEPPGKWHYFDFSDFVQHHELLFFLAWRDIKVRYKQTLLGIGWAVIQPLMLMVVFSFIFGRIGNFNSEGIPYPIFVYSGILPWNLFSKSLSSFRVFLGQLIHLCEGKYTFRRYI